MGRHSDHSTMVQTQSTKSTTTKATNEQLRLARLTQDVHSQETDAQLSEKVRKVMEMTNCRESTAQVALHDCDNDIEQAIGHVMDRREALNEEWIESGKKGKKKQHQQQQSATKQSSDNDFSNDTVPVNQGPRGRGGRRGGGGQQRGQSAGGPMMNNSEAPPRFRGRGAVRGVAGDRPRRNRTEEGTPSADDDLEVNHTGDGGHMRRGGFSGRAGRGGRGGRGGAHHGGDRYNNTRIGTWSDNNTWDNSMASPDGDTSKEATTNGGNVWDNSMAAHLQRHNRQKQNGAVSAGGATSSTSVGDREWTSQNDEWANAAADEEWANKSLVFTASNQAQVVGTKSPSPAYASAAGAAPPGNATSGAPPLDTTGSSSASTAGGKSTYKTQTQQDNVDWRDGSKSGAKPPDDSWSVTQKLKSDLGIGAAARGSAGEAPLGSSVPQPPSQPPPAHLSQPPQQQRVVEFSESLGGGMTGSRQLDIEFGFHSDTTPPANSSANTTTGIAPPSIEKFTVATGPSVDQSVFESNASRTPNKNEPVQSPVSSMGPMSAGGRKDTTTSAQSARSMYPTTPTSQVATSALFTSGANSGTAYNKSPATATAVSQSISLSQPPPAFAPPSTNTTSNNAAANSAVTGTTASSADMQQQQVQPQPTQQAPQPQALPQQLLQQPPSTNPNTSSSDYLPLYPQHQQQLPTGLPLGVAPGKSVTTSDVYGGGDFPAGKMPGAGAISGNLYAQPAASTQIPYNIQNMYTAAAAQYMGRVGASSATWSGSSFPPWKYPSPQDQSLMAQLASTPWAFGPMTAAGMDMSNMAPFLMSQQQQPAQQQAAQQTQQQQQQAPTQQQQTQQNSSTARHDTYSQQPPTAMDYYSGGAAAGTGAVNTSVANELKLSSRPLGSNTDLTQAPPSSATVAPPPGFSAPPSASNAAAAQAIMGATQQQYPAQILGTAPLQYGTTLPFATGIMAMPPVSNGQGAGAAGLPNQYTKQTTYYQAPPFDDVAVPLSGSGTSDFGKQSATSSYGQLSSQANSASKIMPPAADNKQKMYNQSVMMDKQAAAVAAQFGVQSNALATPPPGLPPTFGFAAGNNFAMLSPSIITQPPPAAPQQMQLGDQRSGGVSTTGGQLPRSNSGAKTSAPQQYSAYNWPGAN